jgi:methionine sulfoxide reductase heme-binding subunit
MNSFLSRRWLKPVIFLLCLAPVAILMWRGFHDELGANPIEWITHKTGDWTLRFLVFTLAITPFRKALELPALIKYRRMLGLFAFFYGTLHLMTYVWLDKFFDFGAMLRDVARRPFITAGFTAFVLMIPLALTSTKGWIRRLGGRRWQRLHRLVYASACAGVIHYYWLVKSDVRLPVFYGSLVALLLAWRVVWAIRKRPRPLSAPVESSSRTVAR